ncbi:hypothetical protein [Aquimarina sp. 2304DJ70-9]|uniref:hypothetical protein n=1 Tax=Aquimarina penaris TaxID=3231044 RepID=UPI003462B103
MDDLEKYIKENKLLFDEHKADRSKMWDNIESRMEIPKSNRLWRSPLLKIAASILILISGVSLYELSNISDFNQNQQTNTVHNELHDIDTYYKGLVSLQVQLVKNSQKLQPEDKKEFLSFIDELDNEYDALKLEMTKNLNNEYILEAIINNYKKRIELIENLLKQVNNSKKMNRNEDYIL